MYDFYPDDMSIFDDLFLSDLLFDSLSKQAKNAQNTIDSILEDLMEQIPAFVYGRSLINGDKIEYVVNMSDNVKTAIDMGTVKLVQSDDRIFAQIRNADGKFGERFGIRKEKLSGYDSMQVANLLQMSAMQDQLRKIENQLKTITHDVKDVLQGQQNDRIGLYYSGISLFLEGKSITNPELKNAVMSQSLRALTEASNQLILTMRDDIKYLVNKEFQFAKGGRSKLVAEKMSRINQSFAFIHQSTVLKAGIYCELNELPAMATTFDMYSKFIENTINKNIDVLVGYDKSDDGTKKGIWKTRSNLKIEAAEFAKRLNNPEKTLYLELKQEAE